MLSAIANKETETNLIGMFSPNYAKPYFFCSCQNAQFYLYTMLFEFAHFVLIYSDHDCLVQEVAYIDNNILIFETLVASV